MANGRALIALGLLCLAVSVFAQPLTQQLASGDLSNGSYLVDGSGVVYTDTTISFFVNGTEVASAPIADVPTADPGLDGHHIIDLSATPAPGSGLDHDDLLEQLIEQLLAKPQQENPLDRIIIGRKLKL